MQQLGTDPGKEFYYERLARARAVPEAERSADVRQWLRQAEELEAALAALPVVPASATPQSPLLQPLGGDAALAALLRFIATAFSDCARDPLHPKATPARLSSQLPPFVRVWWEADDQARAVSGRSAFVIYAADLCHMFVACWVQGLITFSERGLFYSPLCR